MARRFRLAVDARELEGRPTGVGRYLANLLRIWQKRDDIELTLYSRTAIEAPGLDVQVVSARRGTTWLGIALPRRLLRDRPDMFLGPAYAIPAAPIPRAVTIHDLSFERYPELFTPADRARRIFLARMAAASSSLVLCDAQVIREEIQGHYRPSCPVEAVPLGIESHFFSPVSDEHVISARERHGIEPPVVLCSGSLFNRRHPDRLVRAFGEVRRSLGHGTLVFAGENRTHPRLDLARVATEAGVGNHTKLLDYVNESELRAMLALADLFVWPSDYEGFGLPPLEAMAAGVPVVSSGRSSMLETMEGAAVLLDDHEVGSLARAMSEVLTQPPLSEDLRRRGLARARQFSWARCAEATLHHLRSTGARS